MLCHLRVLLAATLGAICLSFGGTAMAHSHDKSVMQARAKVAICKVFGPRYCEQALRVSWCESKWYRWAKNGQYLGIFQMGSHERRTYGHGPGAYAQARAAKRYFMASGRDWGPWTCKPWH